MTSLTIDYKGGPKAVRDLAVGEAESFSIRAEGDSALDFSYDQNGEHHMFHVDVYIHSESTGEIQLFIEDDGVVHESDNVG